MDIGTRKIYSISVTNAMKVTRMETPEVVRRMQHIKRCTYNNKKKDQDIIMNANNLNNVIDPDMADVPTILL